MLNVCLCVVFQTAQGGGHRTLLYGHAVLLRHSYSGMVSVCLCVCLCTHVCVCVTYVLCFSLQYLCCLSTARSSTDKLAFDVGLQEDTTGDVTSCLHFMHHLNTQCF